MTPTPPHRLNIILNKPFQKRNKWIKEEKGKEV
jgi:hypothetical protein